jgi:hypothetical protein
MSHFAKVENGIVTQVLVAEQDVINSGLFGDPKLWVQTSYNTSGGVHKLGGTPLRKNFAGVGYTYDAKRDAFISPKSYNSWILDEQTCTWNPPVPYPIDGVSTYTAIAFPGEGTVYKWDEEKINWVVDDSIPKAGA